MAEAIALTVDAKEKKMVQDNRETWLNAVANGMAPLFEAMKAPLPDHIRVAIGFTSTGRKGKAIGECCDNRRSADGHFEIFIQPDLAYAPDAMPVQIAAILAHELIHAAVGIAAGHGKALKRIALGLGLVGPMRATTPRVAFVEAAVPILMRLAPFPTRISTRADSPRRQEADGQAAQMRMRSLRLYGADGPQMAGAGRRAGLPCVGAWSYAA